MISRILDCLLALLIGVGAFHVGWQVSAWIGRGLNITGLIP
jgi:hypothetical protein